MWNTFINTLVCRGRVTHIVESWNPGLEEGEKEEKGENGESIFCTEKGYFDTFLAPGGRPDSKL